MGAVLGEDGVVLALVAGRPAASRGVVDAVEGLHFLPKNSKHFSSLLKVKMSILTFVPAENRTQAIESLQHTCFVSGHMLDTHGFKYRICSLVLYLVGQLELQHLNLYARGQVC